MIAFSRLSPVHVVLALAASGAAAQQLPAAEPPCDTKSTLAQWQAPTRAKKSTCISLQNVLRRLMSHASAAGKKLEENKPLNAPAAAQERREALADAEFVAALNDLLTGETDPLRRLLLEAALLDEHGHYAARDLLVREAKALLGAAQ